MITHQLLSLISISFKQGNQYGKMEFFRFFFYNGGTFSDISSK